MTPDDLGLDALGSEDWELESGRRGRGRPAGGSRRPTRPRPRPRPRPWPPRPLAPWGATVFEPAPAGGAPEPSGEPVAPPVSEYVRWIQSSLNQVAGQRLPVDGVMGPETRSAIRSFQARAGLPADGIVGPDTERALVAARKPRTASARELAALEADSGEDRELGAADPPRPTAPERSTSALASATTFLVRSVGVPASPALAVTNFLDPRIARLANATRPGRSVTELIVHETETWSSAATVTVLQKRKLGVHLILGPDGAFTQHADLGDHVTWHAGDHNGRSVGVEVVNPIFEGHLGLYRRLHPRAAPLPWSRAIRAGWVAGGSYLLPTPAQAEALARLVAWITSPAARGLSVPRRWTGASGGRFAMRLVPGSERVAPGISAHSHVSATKQDGAWLVLYAWLRLEAGMGPAEAYEEAARRASVPGASVAMPASRAPARPEP